MSPAGRFHLLSSDTLSDLSNHPVAPTAQASAISSKQTINNINAHRQDVQALNSQSANSYRQAVDKLNTHQHDLTRQPQRLRTDYYTHGLPQRFPPTPVTTFVSNSFPEPNSANNSHKSDNREQQLHRPTLNSAQPKTTPKQAPSVADSATSSTLTLHDLLPQLSGYMNMLAKKNDTIEGVSNPAPIVPTEQTPSRVEDEIMNWITSPVPDTDASLASYLEEDPCWESSPLFGERDSFDVDDSPAMTTPPIDFGSNDLYTFSPDIYTSPALLDYNSFESASGVGVADIPLMGAPSNVTFASKDGDLGDFWDLPAVEDVSAVAPTTTLHNSAAVTTAVAAPASGDASKDKTKPWTGTRPNLTPAALIPIDAPVQPRSYVTPSATSRKDVPAAFTNRQPKKRTIEEVAIDEELELQRQIEAKRLQNTKAARRSRARKLEYQRKLEEDNAALRAENEQLKMDLQRALGR